VLRGESQLSFNESNTHMTVTSFEVGARFRLIDEFSPALRKMLAQIRELTGVIDKAREHDWQDAWDGRGHWGSRRPIRELDERC
jgi:hypothetical protein